MLLQARLHCLAVIEMSGIRKKDSVSNTILMTRSVFTTSPPPHPHQSLTVSNAIKILELQRWWLNAQLLIFSGRYSTPLSNYGRNQMNCKWNKFPPEHFRFISTCFRFWEHISSIASFIAIISNHYFLLKKEITFETWKISCFEQPFPISCKWKFSKINRITEVLGICIHF